MFVIWELIYDYRFLTMPFYLYHLVPNATAWSNRVSILCALSNINWGTIWPHSKHLLISVSLFQPMNTLQTTKRGALNSGKITIFRKISRLNVVILLHMLKHKKVNKTSPGQRKHVHHLCMTSDDWWCIYLDPQIHSFMENNAHQ